MSAIRLPIIRRLSKVLLLSTLLTLLAGAHGGIQSAEAATTAAVSGVEIVQSYSAYNSLSPKRAIAYCPANKRVIGGGGAIPRYGSDTSILKLTLTELRPVRLYDGTRDAYVVTGAETPSGTTVSWQVFAYAMCANPLPGLNIVSKSTTPSSNSMQATAASCGGVVIGTGASVSTRTGNVVLQVARPSGPGDIARVQAHEVPAGYSGSWSVTSYAVCVPTKPAGYTIVFGESLRRGSETVKVASASCPVGTRQLSAGAAITNTAPGHVALLQIIPGGRGTGAVAHEHTPTSLNWDFIVATAICAY
jgi:hypothetical protein